MYQREKILKKTTTNLIQQLKRIYDPKFYLEYEDNIKIKFASGNIHVYSGKKNLRQARKFSVICVY